LIQGVSFYCLNTLNERNFIMLFEAWRALIPLLTTTKARVIRKAGKAARFLGRATLGIVTTMLSLRHAMFFQRRIQHRATTNCDFAPQYPSTQIN
jgi:hypothetical protein